jgi:hypothetical protein
MQELIHTIGGLMEMEQITNIIQVQFTLILLVLLLLIVFKLIVVMQWEFQIKIIV